METYTLSRWDDNEFIIEKDGKPIGSSVTESSGKLIVDWLNIARHELSK